MYNNVHYSDLPVLIGKGFKFGMFDTVLWGYAKDGQEYQAVIDGEWIRFAQRLPKGNVTQLEQMDREEFNKTF